MKSRRNRTFQFIYAFFAVILFFMILNLALKPLTRHPAAKIYQDLYQGHPTRIHALVPGVELDVRIGVFGPHARMWKKSGATYHIQINSMGYRDREFHDVPPNGVSRVICIGDSSTFGWDVEIHETYSKVLEAKLQKHLEKNNVEVLNCGMPGYSSHSGLIHLEEEVWDLRPDLLIVAYGRNDELDTAYSPTEHGRYLSDKELMPRKGQTSHQIEKLSILSRLRSTNLYQALLRIVSDFQSSKPLDVEHTESELLKVKRRVSLDDYATNLQEICDQAKSRNIPVILVSIGMFIKQYREAMVEIGRKNNIPVLNTFDLLFLKVPDIKSHSDFKRCRERYVSLIGQETMDDSQGGWLYFSTDFGHPNACGHLVIANALYPMMIHTFQHEND